MKKWSLAALLALAAALMAVTNTSLFTADAAKKPLPEQATIRRDTLGVPHIPAETEEAAAYEQATEWHKRRPPLKLEGETK